MRSLETDPTVVERATSYARDVLGKRTIHTKDQAGFVVNALLVPYLCAAVRSSKEEAGPGVGPR
ncbi:hypothetical protein ACFVKB_36410 [Rhodococcus sp. NPDC127530]|uniref:hypothetical protein n=1 Tax=unclassified Rhodococcus (in: high G+C Gram-positive bacteria) TaxID=192944 RepID=UPI00362EE3AA